MDKIIFEKVGKRLKQAREMNHITLEEAGKKVDVHKSTVLRWENGDTEKIKLPIIEILSNYYNVNPVWLMGYDVPMNSNNINIEDKSKKFFLCPVYGKISAGQPNWAEECLDGYLPIDPTLMNINSPDECFFLRVDGESMNKVIKNGAYALIRKTDFVDDGEIAVVLVNGFDATLKKFSKQGDFIVLEPMSDDPSIKTQIYTKDTSIKVIGKYVGKFEINQ